MHTREWLLAAVVTAACSVWFQPADAREPSDPFAFFEPSLRVSASDRARLDTGEVVARTLPGDDGHLALFAATRLNAPPVALLEWTRRIEDLKRSPLVLALGRFSNPVADNDLETLVLDSSEIDALGRCHVGNCALKLAASEVLEIQHAIGAAGPEWREAAQRAFRRVLIGRVRVHQQRGLLAVPPYADRGRRMSVGEAFTAMAARSPYLTRAFPDVVNSLLTPAREPKGSDAAFYYWSRDKYGSRTVISVTYVRLLQPTAPDVPRALTVSTQLYASHYVEGALSLSAVVCDDANSVCYLAYLNRTQVDVLGGLFGSFKRAVIENRLESEAPTLLRGVRRRLESGPPVPSGGES